MARFRFDRWTPVFLFLSASLVLSAQNESRGALDANFGAGGKVITGFANGTASAGSVAALPDGKLVAAGTFFTNTGIGAFALTRYTSDGVLDVSFGDAGRVTTGFAGGAAGAASLAVQPDGKLIAAGWIFFNGGGGDFAIARYNSDGALDTSFGVGGKVTTDFTGGSDVASSVAIQPDGKIVVAGTASTGGGTITFALARYNSDGTLDESFGAGGKVTTNVAGGGLSEALSVALQPDGKIVAAGTALVDRVFDFGLARYNSDGSLDTSFGVGGQVTTDFAGSGDRAFSVVIQLDGKIIAAGQAYNPGADDLGDGDFALARYDSNGTLDPGFGNGGKITTNFGGSYDSAASVALQPNGKIIVAGTAPVNGGVSFALARYDSNGALDSAFGAGGTVITDFAAGRTLSHALSVAVQPDGKILAAGGAVVNDVLGFALARYEIAVEE